MEIKVNNSAAFQTNLPQNLTATFLHPVILKHNKNNNKKNIHFEFHRLQATKQGKVRQS